MKTPLALAAFGLTAPFGAVLLVHVLWTLTLGLGWDPLAAGMAAALFGAVGFAAILLAVVWAACDWWDSRST